MASSGTLARGARRETSVSRAFPGVRDGADSGRAACQHPGWPGDRKHQRQNRPGRAFRPPPPCGWAGDCRSALPENEVDGPDIGLSLGLHPGILASTVLRAKRKSDAGLSGDYLSPEWNAVSRFGEHEREPDPEPDVLLDWRLPLSVGCIAGPHVPFGVPGRDVCSTIHLASDGRATDPLEPAVHREG